MGVGLVDILQDNISAVYFFYDHDYQHLSLGTFNILMQLRIAKEKKLRYFYPGYWIDGHGSMGYKERFKPFECLINTPDIFDSTQWLLHTKEIDIAQKKEEYINSALQKAQPSQPLYEDSKQMQGVLPAQEQNEDFYNNTGKPR